MRCSASRTFSHCSVPWLIATAGRGDSSCWGRHRLICSISVVSRSPAALPTLTSNRSAMTKWRHTVTSFNTGCGSSCSRHVRIVLDTNVLISGVLTPHAAPGSVVNSVLDYRVTVLVDDRILFEYRDVLKRPRFASPLNYVQALLKSSSSFCAATNNRFRSRIIYLVTRVSGPRRLQREPRLRRPWRYDATTAGSNNPKYDDYKNHDYQCADNKTHLTLLPSG